MELSYLVFLIVYKMCKKISVVYLVALITFVMAVSVDAQIYANGTILKDDPVFMCTRPGPQCADDCVSLLLCAAEETEPFEVVTCGKSSPSTPYCIENTCSKTPGDCTSAAAFRCTGEGVFPDPLNCTRYRLCDGSNGNSELFECPKGYQFNSKINLCEMGKSLHSKICSQIDCSKKTNEVVVYKSNPAYFAFCFVDPVEKTRETIMFKCEFEYEVYDPSENICKFNCKSAGHFQDPTDCNSYYVCSSAPFGTYTSKKIPCPTDYFFDGTGCSLDSSKCLDGSLKNLVVPSS